MHLEKPEAKPERKLLTSVMLGSLLAASASMMGGARYHSEPNTNVVNMGSCVETQSKRKQARKLGKKNRSNRGKRR